MPTRAVLLDALGTLVALERPWPHLQAALARRGVSVSLPDAERAMRAEIAHYRAHHDRAGTPAGLAELRTACARVVQAELGTALPEPEAVAVLLEAVRFVAYPDVVPTLRALRERGTALVVVSNWDVSLHEALARTGLAPLLDGAVSSAEAGAAKPDPAIFLAALARVGVKAEDALHAGDDPALDVAGARAAGLRAVLIARDEAAGLRSAGAGGAVEPGTTILPDLTGLIDLVT